jgi:hypothetical protein
MWRGQEKVLKPLSSLSRGLSQQFRYKMPGIRLNMKMKDREIP